jgi:hypothetical protein
MKPLEVALILLGVAGLAVVGWLLLRPGGNLPILPSTPVWEVAAADPIVIGNRADPFVYAGGAGIQTASGTGTLRLYAPDREGSLDLALDLSNAAVSADGTVPRGEVDITASLRPAATDLSGGTIHGTTGRGDSRLPETQALLFGSAAFAVGVRGNPQRTTFEGIWSVAQALRREDGAIRNQGLVFSPLLRDDTVFADPKRLELTVLLYDAAPNQTRSVVLQVVYRDVEVLTSPAGGGATD